jgi:hypothetical protein
MPEATGELPENVLVPDRNPFRVLRFVPAKFLNGCDDPLIIARVDFIHCHYKFFLFDCDLRCEPDFGEADVCISDLKPLLRYYLEPNFSGEIEFEELQNQLDSAICHFLGIAESDRRPEHILYDFVTGPEWPGWLAGNHQVPALLSALLDYMMRG